MKKYKDYIEDTERRRTKVIYSQRNGFRTKLVEDSWKKVLRMDGIQVGDVFGSSDGLVKVKEVINKSKGNDCYWCSVITPSHNEVSKNDIFSYSVDELFVGEDDNPDNWKLEMLRDDIIDQPKHKKIDKINTKPVVEDFSSIFQDGEISSTDQLLRWLGLIVGELINRNKKEKR